MMMMMMMMKKKKLDGGLKIILFFFLFFIFSSKSSYGSQILDYETEEFLNLIIQDIIKVNKIIIIDVNNPG